VHVNVDFVVGVPGMTVMGVETPALPDTVIARIDVIWAAVVAPLNVNVIVAPSLFDTRGVTVPFDGTTVNWFADARVMPAALAGVMVHDVVLKVTTDDAVHTTVVAAPVTIARWRATIV